MKGDTGMSVPFFITARFERMIAQTRLTDIHANAILLHSKLKSKKHVINSRNIH
jgi:hypothetical protein